ncbi:uncharacterized protein BKA55DRAFT_569599, partial [Fusarium redolens]
MPVSYDTGIMIGDSGESYIYVEPEVGDSKRDMSTATLWLTGNWNAITLDGSPDEDFERMSRETAVKLKGALDKLKD